MAAPIVAPLDIEQRLEAILDDNLDTIKPEDARETKPEGPKARPPKAAEPKVATETDSPELAALEVETDPEADPIVDPEADPEVSVEADAVTDDPDDVGINTVTQLAKMFDVEETELLDHLQIDTGDGQSVSLSQVVASYKTAPEATRNYEEFERNRAAFQTEATQMREKTDAQVRELAVHAQVLLDLVNEEFGTVNWQELEQQDPTQFLILKGRKTERAQAIRVAIDQLRVADEQRSINTPQGTVKDQKVEMAALARKMPEWSDKEVANAAMVLTNTYLAEDIGFTKEQIDGIEDHRYLLVAYDAAQYRQLKKQAPKKLDNLRKLPKPKAVLRSTARRDTGVDARKKTQQKFDRLKKTGTEEDAARLLEDLL